MSDIKKQIGQAGEEVTCKHLKQRGWKILARNWRPCGAHHSLELDIVAKDNDTLVFVEVKTRTYSAKIAESLLQRISLARVVPLATEEKKGTMTKLISLCQGSANSKESDLLYPERDIIPAYTAFTKKKRESMLRAAQHYLAGAQRENTPCRFDLVCLQEDSKGKFWIEHYEHVIETGEAMGNSHSYWEPW